MSYTLVAYGMGVNSTAMIVEAVARGERIDAILTGDTGGERKETYAYRDLFSEWCVAHGFPPVITVRKVGPTLEQDCLNRKALPSVAYGSKSCSDHYKIRPQEKWAKENCEITSLWERRERVTRWIGYDMDEPHRWFGKDWSNKRYVYRAPLIEWGMGRDECVASIEAAGLPVPPKSACFFCPSSKPREILALDPGLLDRALAMECNADLTSIKGLGRSYAWSDLVRADRAQIDMFKAVEIACGCYDGEPA